MIKTTRWSPDTCQCILEYTWDTEQPENARIHTPARIVKTCQAHSGDTQSVFTNVRNENVKKNRAVQKVADADPTLNVTDPDGNKSPDLKKIKFSFDAQRKLKIRIEDPDTAKKAKVQKALDDEFGKDNVSVE